MKVAGVKAFLGYLQVIIVLNTNLPETSFFFFNIRNNRKTIFSILALSPTTVLCKFFGSVSYICMRQTVSLDVTVYHQNSWECQDSNSWVKRLIAW